MVTENLSKKAAQQRVEQIKAFYNELSMLQEDDILQVKDEEMARVKRYHHTLQNNLLHQYDVDVSQGSKNLTRGMQIASFWGALALASSVFFLFYQFWGYLNTTLQVLILAAAPVLTLIATYAIHSLEKTSHFAQLMALTSFACFVLNLVMLGQIFNIEPSDNALLAWCLYGYGLAYAFNIRLLVSIANACFYGFAAARLCSWSGMYWMSIGSYMELFFIPALILFFVPLLIKQQHYHGFSDAYHEDSLYGFLIPITVLSMWGESSFLPVDPDFIEGFYQIAGFVASAGFTAFAIKQSLPRLMNMGSGFFVMFLYIKMFDWFWDWMPKYLFFFLMGMIALLFMLLFNRLRKNLKDAVAQEGANP